MLREKENNATNATTGSITGRARSARNLEASALGGVTGLLVAIAASMLLASPGPQAAAGGTLVHSKESDITGSLGISTESLCDAKSPIASITIDGETIELFITQSTE
jgi:hypothetical protein